MGKVTNEEEKFIKNIKKADNTWVVDDFKLNLG